MGFQGISSPISCSEPGHLWNQTRFFKALATWVLKTQGWRLLTVMLVVKKIFIRPSQNLLFQLTLSRPSSMPCCEGPGSIFPVTCPEALGILLSGTPQTRLNTVPQPLFLGRELQPWPFWCSPLHSLQFITMLLALDIPKLDFSWCLGYSADNTALDFLRVYCWLILSLLFTKNICSLQRQEGWSHTR